MNSSIKYCVFNNVFNRHLRICSKVFLCLLLLQPKHAQLPCLVEYIIWYVFHDLFILKIWLNRKSNIIIHNLNPHQFRKKTKWNFSRKNTFERKIIYIIWVALRCSICVYFCLLSLEWKTWWRHEEKLTYIESFIFLSCKYFVIISSHSVQWLYREKYLFINKYLVLSINEVFLFKEIYTP